MLKVEHTKIDGVLVLEPDVIQDARGYFMEAYNQKAFDAILGRAVRFVQDNQSRSTRGVLRGLHYQIPPHAQAKLVRVTHGGVFSVAVDLCRHSPTFGRWVGMELSDSNRRQLWLPAGIAHGFLVTSESAECLYKTTDFYAPDFERSVRWNDPALAIDWPLQDKAPMLSERDADAPSLAEATLFE